MADEFRVRVCAPQGIVLEETVREVMLPSSDGTIGVLPGHADYTGVLGTGVLELVPAAGSSAKRLVVSGGFVSVQAGTLLILCDQVDRLDTVDRESYANSRADFQRVVETAAVDSLEWQRAKSSLQRIEAIDELISH